MARIRSDRLKDLVRDIMITRADQVNCEGCFEQLDHFVELKLDGVDVRQAMPLVQNHLDDCDGCCEEYEALLEALQSMHPAE